MTDVNYISYGENALRVANSVGDNLDFWAINSYSLGAIIGVLLILAIIIFTIILLARYGKRLLP